MVGCLIATRDNDLEVVVINSQRAVLNVLDRVPHDDTITHVNRIPAPVEVKNLLVLRHSPVLVDNAAKNDILLPVGGPVGLQDVLDNLDYIIVAVKIEMNTLVTYMISVSTSEGATRDVYRLIQY